MKKERAYTLWLKWRNLGWAPYFTIKTTRAGGQGIDAPVKFLNRWAFDNFPSGWGDNWRRLVRVLPEGRVPKGR